MLTWGPKALDGQSYQSVELPPGQSEVTIYLDPETEAIPTTAHVDDAGHSNVMLARLFLDRLGAQNNVLRLLGLLSTSCIYVMNDYITPWEADDLRQ